MSLSSPRWRSWSEKTPRGRLVVDVGSKGYVLPRWVTVCDCWFAWLVSSAAWLAWWCGLKLYWFLYAYTQNPIGRGRWLHPSHDVTTVSSWIITTETSPTIALSPWGRILATKWCLSSSVSVGFWSPVCHLNPEVISDPYKSSQGSGSHPKDEQIRFRRPRLCARHVGLTVGVAITTLSGIIRRR